MSEFSDFDKGYHAAMYDLDGWFLDWEMVQSNMGTIEQVARVGTLSCSEYISHQLECYIDSSDNPPWSPQHDREANQAYLNQGILDL